MPTLTRNGSTIYYEKHGSGPALVLGHSFLTSGEMWAQQIPAWQKYACVINVEFRGHGRSMPVKGAFDLYDLVADVIAVLDALKIERAVWAGLSMGGMVALRAALVHPQRVCGLVLMDTHAGSETLFGKMKARFMTQTAKVMGLSFLLPAMMAIMFGRTTRQNNPDLIQHWQNEILKMDMAETGAVFAAVVARDSLIGKLGQISVPSLVIVGEEDTALPPIFSKQIAAELPDARLLMIPQCGHMAALEQPLAVTDAVNDFLRREFG